jgi:hypothetical protein
VYEQGLLISPTGTRYAASWFFASALLKRKQSATKENKIKNKRFNTAIGAPVFMLNETP